MKHTMSVAAMAGLALTAALLAALPAHMAQAQAQDWPARPVTLVVPYPPGGNVDVAARIVAIEMQKLLRQTVIVDNKAGAGGMIAGEYVAKSAPDGYTVFFAANGPVLFSPAIFGRAPYYWQKDFTPVSSVSFTPLVLQVHPSTPFKTVKDLIEAARARPGEITMASPGAGTTNHLMSELLQTRTGAKWTTVHYKGNTPATTDLLGGQVQFNFDQITVAQQSIKQGRLRGLAVTSPQRLPSLPDIPTLEEAGYKGMNGMTFTGLFVPVATPRAVVARLNEVVNKVLLEKGVIERMEAAGTQAGGMSQSDFVDYLKKEEALWLPVIKAASIKAD